MAKLAGSAATKITELRKALDAAQQEVKLLRSRHLQTENSKLRRENEALRAILDSIDGQETICLTPPATGRSQSFISPPNSSVRKPTPREIERRSSLLVRPSKATTRRPAKPATEATMTEANSPHTHTSDVARSATIHGQKYVYRRGELVWLDERQASVLDQPCFMQPTHASNEKKSSKQPFDYLRKKVRPANYSRYDSRSSSGTEGSKPSGATESWSSWDTVDHEWGTNTQSVDSREETPNTSESGENAESTEESSKGKEFRLHEYLDEDLKYMLVHSAFGFLTLEKGLKLAQVVFWEQARLHWPTVFEGIKSGPHMVKMSWAEMSSYMNRLSINALKVVCSNPTSLRYNLTNYVKDTRNLLAHPEERFLINPDNLDHHLRHIQHMVYLMGDFTRAQEVRALRDEVAAEAGRLRDKMMALDYLIALPMCAVTPDDEDMEWLREHDSKFAQVLEERYRSRETAQDYLLRVAEFYVTKSTDLGHHCWKLMNDESFWLYTARWGHRITG